MKPFYYRVLIVISVVGATVFLVATYSGMLDGLRNSPPDKIMGWFPHFGQAWLFINSYISVLQTLCIFYILVIALIPVTRYLLTQKSHFLEFVSFLWSNLRKLLLFIWNN